MKILLVATPFLRNDSRIFGKQAKTLARNGHRVTILCSDNLQQPSISNIEFLPLKKRFRTRFGRIFLGPIYICQQMKKIDFDVVQFNSPEALFLVRKFKKFGKKIVFDFREDYPAFITEKKWIPHFLRKFISKIYENFENKIISLLDGVITPTPFLYERFQKSHKNVFMVTNYPIIENQVVLKKDFTGDLCFYGYSFGDDLNLNVLKAIQDIPNIKFHLLLGNSGKEAMKIQKMTEELNLSDRVFLYDRISPEQIPTFLQKASVGIVLKRYAANYGFKRGSLGVIKFFDYLANQLPVLCTDFDEWKIIVESYSCGIYVNPYDVDAIKQAIKSFLSDPQNSLKMGQNGRKAVEEKFNWSTQESTYLRIFESM